MNKKILIGIVLALVAVSGVTAFAVFRKKSPEPVVEKSKKKVSKPVNIIPYEQRPYIAMAPTSSREVDVTVYTLPKEAQSAEYLAEYQYGTSLGGNEQLIEFDGGLPATKQFALYSRSAGGKTSYEEDVQGGTLRLDFQGGEEYALEQEWKYFDNKDKDTSFSSKDGKFTISAKELGTARYVITYNSPGLPDVLPGDRLSEVYTFRAAPAATAATAKKVEVTIEMDSAGTGSIMGWDGKEWQKFETSVSGNKATASVDLLEAYVVSGE